MVEVDIEDVVIVLAPVNMVLPPCKDKVLLLSVSVPEPAVKVLPLTDSKVTAPVLATVNWLLFPTVSNWLGLVVPMPTLPSI